MQALNASFLPALGNFPTNGRRYPRFMPKSGKESRPKKRPSAIALVVADNLKELFVYASRVPELADRASPELLAKYIADRHWGNSVGKSQVYRLMKAEGGAPGADFLDLIARAYDLAAWHLLLPKLDPGNPPSVITDPRERALWGTLTTGMRTLEQERRNAQNAATEATGHDHDPAGATHGEGNVRAGAKPAPAKNARKKAKAS